MDPCARFVPTDTTHRDRSRWNVGIRRAPIRVAAEANANSQRKSPTPLVTPAAMFCSTRLARSGAWNELDVRDTNISTLNNDSDKAIRRVRVPAIRTE